MAEDEDAQHYGDDFASRGDEGEHMLLEIGYHLVDASLTYHLQYAHDRDVQDAVRVIYKEAERLNDGTLN